MSQLVFYANKSITWMEVSVNYAVLKSKVVSVVYQVQFVCNAKVGMFLIQKVINAKSTPFKQNKKFKDSNWSVITSVRVCSSMSYLPKESLLNQSTPSISLMAEKQNYWLKITQVNKLYWPYFHINSLRTDTQSYFTLTIHWEVK